jgi:hypothetical protein
MRRLRATDTAVRAGHRNFDLYVAPFRVVVLGIFFPSLICLDFYNSGFSSVGLC